MDTVPEYNRVRNMYEKVSHYVPFDTILTRYSLPDLEYLLKDADPLKLTYIYNEEPLPKGGELHHYIDANIGAYIAQQAIKHGYTFATFQKALSLCKEIDNSYKYWQDLLVRSPPITTEFLQSCLDARLNREWVIAGIETQASFEQVQLFRQAEVPVRYVTRSSLAVATNIAAVRAWYKSSISPLAIDVFAEFGVDALTAAAWLQAGFLPREAVDYIQSGVSLTQARAEMPAIAYSKAFRKVRPDGWAIRMEFKDRVSHAVRCIDVPSLRHSTMFAPAYTSWGFLDGGYKTVDGYGFRSHSYQLIIGKKALTLICYHIGVQPIKPKPRDPTNLSLESLEAELRDQRLNHLNKLIDQANSLLFM